MKRERGTPIKVTIGDQPVFPCCKGCEKRSMEKPADTLAKLKSMKAKSTAVTPK